MLLPKQSRMTMAGLTIACSLFLAACAPKETVQLNVIPLPAQLAASGGFSKLTVQQSSQRKNLQMFILPWTNP